MMSNFDVVSPTGPLSLIFFVLTLTFPLTLSTALFFSKVLPSLPSFGIYSFSDSFHFFSYTFSQLLLSLTFLHSLDRGFLFTSFGGNRGLCDISVLGHPFAMVTH